MKARRGEQVHHRNGVKDDNRPENLVVMTRKEHGAEHATYPVDEIGRLYQDGKSTLEIAAILGCDSSVAFRSLQRSGVATRSASEAQLRRYATNPRKRKYDDAVVARLYLSGMSAREVGVVLGVNKRTVYFSLERSGTPRRKGNSNA